MSNSIKKRVKRLSAHSEEWGDVLALIRAKKRYSELTDEQKERYCRYYHGMDRATIEEIGKWSQANRSTLFLKKSHLK